MAAPIEEEQGAQTDSSQAAIDIRSETILKVGQARTTSTHPSGLKLVDIISTNISHITSSTKSVVLLVVIQLETRGICGPIQEM